MKLQYLDGAFEHNFGSMDQEFQWTNLQKFKFLRGRGEEKTSVLQSIETK